MNSNAQISTSVSNAASAGIISAQSQAAILDLDDIALAGCTGISPDDVDSEEVTLVQVLIDAS
ncbi:MAG: hypothetical protein WC341_12890, partial [Bacteroidales bacterium]